jgi:nucleoside-diphosphate-sugar epimerase
MVVLAGVTPAQGRDLSLNTDIAIACLSAAMEAKIPRVLIASSSAVYGTGDGTPFAEAAECNPVNDYGWAKFAMENACRVMAGSDVEICCLRIGNVAGADALLLNVARMGLNNPVMIDTFADGRGPVRSYIGPKSLARVLSTIALQEATLPPVLNIASPCAISMDALATAAEHPWHAQPAPANMPQSITLDISLLRQSCDFSSEESCASEMVLQWKETLSR